VGVGAVKLHCASKRKKNAGFKSIRIIYSK
jgi:hypothetical protein